MTSPQTPVTPSPREVANTVVSDPDFFNGPLRSENNVWSDNVILFPSQSQTNIDSKLLTYVPHFPALPPTLREETGLKVEEDLTNPLFRHTLQPRQFNNQLPLEVPTLHPYSVDRDLPRARLPVGNPQNSRFYGVSKIAEGRWRGYVKCKSERKIMQMEIGVYETEDSAAEAVRTFTMQGLDQHVNSSGLRIMGQHWGTLKFGANPVDMEPVQPHPRRGVKRQPTTTERKVKRKRTGSKYKGVSWDSRSERWLCRVKWQKKLKYVGYFDSELEAARRHDERARELYAGNLSAIELNFPDPPVVFMQPWATYCNPYLF